LTFAGTFSDGRTAARHDVAVALTTQGLVVSGATIAPLSWPLGDVRVLESDQPLPLRLTRRSDDEPRLVVADPGFRDQLFSRLPALDPHHCRFRRTVALVAGSLGATAALAALLWFGLPLAAKPIAALVPHSVEARIGDRILDFVVGDRDVCENPEGAAALQRLRERVVAGAAGTVDISVQVVNSPMVNAIAAPGGSILIFSGLLKKVESADEVAGVLGHEIGHVAHRHGMQALVRHFALSMVITVFTGNDWGIGSAAQFFVQSAYSREAEAEADATGVAMLERAGLRADGLATFFTRLQKEHEGESPRALFRYFSSHPPSAERSAATARDGSGRPVLSDAEWAALKEICRKD
jgi:Zn-dependent protease with chaperone function